MYIWVIELSGYANGFVQPQWEPTVMCYLSKKDAQDNIKFIRKNARNFKFRARRYIAA